MLLKGRNHGISMGLEGEEGKNGKVEGIKGSGGEGKQVGEFRRGRNIQKRPESMRNYGFYLMTSSLQTRPTSNYITT